MDDTIIYLVGARGAGAPRIAREVAARSGFGFLEEADVHVDGSWVLAQELDGDGAAAEAVFGRVAAMAQRQRRLFVPVHVVGSADRGYDPDHPNQLTLHAARLAPDESARAILDHALALRVAE